MHLRESRPLGFLLRAPTVFLSLSLSLTCGMHIGFPSFTSAVGRDDRRGHALQQDGASAAQGPGVESSTTSLQTPLACKRMPRSVKPLWLLNLLVVVAVDDYCWLVPVATLEKIEATSYFCRPRLSP